MYMKEKLYYIVGVSLLVLLVLVVYVGSRVENVEMGLAIVDSRLAVIETQLGLGAEATSYYADPSADEYDMSASAYDAFMGSDASYAPEAPAFIPYDYTTN